MKKSAVFIVILVIALVFSGCAPEYPEIDVPEVTEPLENTEIPGSAEYSKTTENLPWERNAEEHWKIGENGEKIETGLHDFDYIGICSVCHCEVSESDSGSYVIYEVDQYGNYVRITYYNSAGNIYDEIISEFKYDENGNKVFEKTYPNPKYRSADEINPTESFTAEFEYAQDSLGLYYFSKIKTTYGNGSATIEEYIDSRRVSSTVYFDCDGNKLSELFYEYSENENGTKYLSEYIEHDCIYGTKYIYGYDEIGNVLYLEELDAEGKTVRRDEFKYDD